MPPIKLLMQTDASKLCPSGCRLESLLQVKTPFEELSELEKVDHNKRAEVKRLKKEAKAKKAQRDEEVGGSLNPSHISCIPPLCAEV